METVSIFDWLEKSKKTILVSGSSKVKSHYRTIEVSDKIDEQKNKTKNNKYEQIRRISSDIIEGRKSIIRLDERGEEGRIYAGGTAIEATCILGEYRRAASALYRESEEKRDPTIGNLESKEEQLLTNYAKVEGKWYNYNEIKDNTIKQLNSGTEADVFVYNNERLRKLGLPLNSDDSKCVVKIVDYRVGGSLLPSEYIDNRIALYNSLFPETKYELLGFTKNKDGDFAFVLKQSYIKGHELEDELIYDEDDDYAENTDELEDEIIDWLDTNLGLKWKRSGTYINDDYIIDDVNFSNVIRQNKTNKLVFIDVIPRLNTSNSDFKGTNHYREFDIVDNEIKKSETVTIFEYLRIKRKL